MRVGLVLDPSFEKHDTGPGHPERPARLARCRATFEERGLVGRCEAVAIRPADDTMLERVHDAAYIGRVRNACESGASTLDSEDTAICPESERLARLAAGSLVGLVDEVVSGRIERGFAAVRPPGHHAERGLAMGFCLFNNIAVAAAHLRAAHALSRVLVVDWDVHHGNGTQHIFEEDPSVFFFSIHQSPLYPGTGVRSETGRGDGAGTTLNCPLPPGAGDAEFLGALRDELLPAARAFQPEFVLLSAGFDAHRRDPLANLEVTTGAFGEATELLCDLAGELAGGRIVSTLEGGYDLGALSESAALHVETLLDHPA